MIVRIIIDIFLVIGLFFIFAGVVGMLRMPDTYCRLQSSTNIVTMGGLPILIAAAIYGFYTGNIAIGIKSIIIGIFIVLTNPAASHAMTKAAYKIGTPMFKKDSYLKGKE